MKNLSLQSMQANPLRNTSEVTRVESRLNQSEASTEKQSFQAELSSQVKARQNQAKSSQQKANQDDKKNGVKLGGNVPDEKQTKQAGLEANLEDSSIRGLGSKGSEESKFADIAKITDIILSLPIEGIESNLLQNTGDFASSSGNKPLKTNSSNDMESDLASLAEAEKKTTELSSDAIASMSIPFLQAPPSLSIPLPIDKKANLNLAEGKNGLRGPSDVSVSTMKSSNPSFDIEDKQGVGANQKGVLGLNHSENGLEHSNRIGEGSSQQTIETKVLPEKTGHFDNVMLRNNESNASNQKQNLVDSAQMLGLTKANVEKASLAIEKTGSEPIAAANLVSMLQVNMPAAIQQAGSSNSIQIYPGKSGWDQAISQKVVWMIGAGEQSATLTLNPPDLGPLQVVIRVHNDQADTTFISGNAEVRQALENGLSTLREKMNEAGIQLGQANVSTNGQSQQTFQQATQNQFTRQTALAGGLANEVQQTVVNGDSSSINDVSTGLVDTFA